MSFRVLVIPEDFTKDEHVLGPLVERILEECGRRAQVEVCRDPNFQGVDAALNLERLRSEVVARYPMVDMFVLFVDRDGRQGREVSVNRIETELMSELGQHRRHFFAEVAWQEVEIFILAGHELPARWRWKEIRADEDVKNTYFRRFVEIRDTSRYPHDGRKKLMAEAITNWQRIKSRCPEDIGALIHRISELP